MRIALVVTPFSDENLRLAAQIGVTDIVARFPGHHGCSLESIKDQIESAGLRLSVVEGYIPHNLIVHAKPGRDDQIAGFEQLLRDMGRLGVSICCYNFMPEDDWTRTSVTSPERGGALTTAFAKPSTTTERPTCWPRCEPTTKSDLPDRCGQTTYRSSQANPPTTPATPCSVASGPSAT